MELSRGDGRDLAAQSSQRQMMNARENAAIAPFDFFGRFRTVMSLEDLALGFEGAKRDADIV